MRCLCTRVHTRHSYLEQNIQFLQLFDTEGRVSHDGSHLHAYTSSLTTHQWTGFKSLKRARALTTLLLAVSSKDCMTFNLCLNLICSMTSARRLPNFYKKCTKRKKEKANRARKENYWLRHLHRRIKHVEVKEGFVPPHPKPHRTS